jgi:uncharacterized protein (TIGR03492 family)
MDRILFISNGHGEDSIAVKVIDQIKTLISRPLEIFAWPMVGRGESFSSRGVPVTGPPNLLPSCGFATLSLRLMWKDLLHGWVTTHLRQIRAARSLKGRYSLIVAVGDVVPIGASVLSGSPFFLIGCAKSSYYSRWSGYTKLEKFLLRRFCLMTFPRDELTAEELTRARVPNRYHGNPMMDGLEGTDGFPLWPGGHPVVGMIPGSRPDAEENALFLLKPAAFLDVPCLFAAYDGLDVRWIADKIRIAEAGQDWAVEQECSAESVGGVVLKLIHSRGNRAWFIKGRFADVLRRSTLVVGVSGTANEQAVGLGKPLITFPTPGVMGPRYVKMKMQFFGLSARMVPPKTEEIARAVRELLRDEELRGGMASAGRERMGRPGASRAIAREIINHLTGNGSR